MPLDPVTDDRRLESETGRQTSGPGQGDATKKEHKATTVHRGWGQARIRVIHSAEKEDQLWEEFKRSARRFGSDDFCSTLRTNSQILQCYAKLYTFADYFGIGSLINLAFNSLGEALITFDCRGGPASDVVALIQFYYNRPVPDELKWLVTLYGAAK